MPFEQLRAMHRPPGAVDGARPTHDRGEADPRPLAGYGLLLGVYSGLAGTATWFLRRRGARVDPAGPLEMAMLGLATAHISRLVTKDSVTGVLRAPFTTFDEPGGEGESNEQVTRPGVAHAVGELLTCPFCTAQWVATALVVGRATVPQLTAGVVTVAAVARLADFVQLLYGAARRLA